MATMLKEMKLKAEGITCSSCTADMEKLLLAVKGISAASVSFADEIIDIRYNPDIIDRKQVYTAARKLGYKIKILSESS